MANILKLTNFSDVSIWTIVKNIKLETTLDKSCSDDGLFSDKGNDTVMQVLKVEKYLKMKSTSQIFENMTNETMKVAAQMFIYLNICPFGSKAEFLSDERQRARKLWFTSKP